MRAFVWLALAACGSDAGGSRPDGHVSPTLFTEPMISQRVVNDTAHVLAEIDERYPPASP